MAAVHDPLGPVVAALLDDGHARLRFRVDPLGCLADHGLDARALGALADRLAVASEARPATERRALQALVFVALAVAAGRSE